MCRWGSRALLRYEYYNEPAKKKKKNRNGDVADQNMDITSENK